MLQGVLARFIGNQGWKLWPTSSSRFPEIPAVGFIAKVSVVSGRYRQMSSVCSSTIVRYRSSATRSAFLGSLAFLDEIARTAGIPQPR